MNQISLFIIILTLTSSPLWAQAIPDQKVLAIEELADYLKAMDLYLRLKDSNLTIQLLGDVETSVRMSQEVLNSNNETTIELEPGERHYFKLY